MLTRAGHAFGYFDVRSLATVTWMRGSNAERSGSTTPRSEKWSEENTSSGAPPYVSAAAAQYARLNFAAYGVLGFRSFTISYPGPYVSMSIDATSLGVMPRWVRRSTMMSIALCVWPQHAQTL